MIRLEDLTTGQWWALWWGILWRSLVIAAAAAACAFFLAFCAGFLTGLAVVGSGKSIEDYRLPLQVVGGLIGMLVGAGFFFLQIRWWFKGSYSGLQLALVKESPPLLTEEHNPA
jgi:ABC-type spermidine/putrescine transport system permease subunit II